MELDALLEMSLRDMDAEGQEGGGAAGGCSSVFGELEPLEAGPDLQQQRELVQQPQHRTLQEGPVGMEQIFQLLEAASRGRMAPEVPRRPQASPIDPATQLFFVTPELKQQLCESELQNTLGKPQELIGVKYQGFPNGEVWWSRDDCLGLVSRNMTRRARNASKSAASEHGFAGKLYSLLWRSSPDVKITKTNRREHLVPGVPSVVQFWPADPDRRAAKRPRLKLEIAPDATAADKCSVASRASSDTAASYDSTSAESASASASPATCSSSSSSSSTSARDIGGGGGGPDACTLVRGDMRVRGDLVVNGDLAARDLHVTGKLTVDGGISGRLVTPPDAADYAEWFPFLDGAGKGIEAGHVVQLRAPFQRITLDTTGEGPVMVVSTSPSVAAGVPCHPERARDGRLVAFLGQVPVRVRGPVRCGDHLVPSGDGDGLAVTGRPGHTRDEPIATAMAACGPGIHLVNSFVRWPHNRSWSSKRRQADALHIDAVASWRTALFCVAYLVLRGLLLHNSLPLAGLVLLALELLHLAHLFAHFPVYPEFASRDFWLGITLFGLDLVVTAGAVWRDVIDGQLGDPGEAISAGQLRSVLGQLAAAQLHVVVVVILLRAYFRARLAILALLPDDNSERADWRKRLRGTTIGGLL